MTSRDIGDRVEFRWRDHEKHYAVKLAQSAEKSGRSPTEHARALLKDALTADDLLQHAVECLHQEVAQLQHQLRVLTTIKEGTRAVHENIYALRDDLAACVVELLVNAGHLDPKTARRLVRKIFRVE